MTRWLVACSVILAGCAEARSAPEPDEVEVAIQEWEVPWEDTRPRDPDVAGDGTVWFVGQEGDYLARFDPDDERFDKVDLPEGTGPHDAEIGPAGAPWYAGNKAAHVGRYDPAERAIHQLAMPTPLQDPHTLRFAPDGDLWFTAQMSNHIGHLHLPEEDITEVREEWVTAINVATDGARPYGLVLSGDRPWVALFGTNALGTVDPETKDLREIELPAEDARPRRIGVTSDGAVWYGDFARGYLGRMDPETEQVREWALPGGAASYPYALAVDGSDRVWLVETGTAPNRLVGFDPAQEAWVATVEIPSGGGTVRNMELHDGALWFGTDRNTLGRATLGD